MVRIGVLATGRPQPISWAFAGRRRTLSFLRLLRNGFLQLLRLLSSPLVGILDLGAVSPLSIRRSLN